DRTYAAPMQCVKRSDGTKAIAEVDGRETLMLCTRSQPPPDSSSCHSIGKAPPGYRCSSTRRRGAWHSITRKGCLATHCNTTAAREAGTRRPVTPTSGGASNQTLATAVFQSGNSLGSPTTCQTSSTPAATCCFL